MPYTYDTCLSVVKLRFLSGTLPNFTGYCKGFCYLHAGFNIHKTVVNIVSLHTPISDFQAVRLTSPDLQQPRVKAIFGYCILRWKNISTLFPAIIYCFIFRLHIQLVITNLQPGLRPNSKHHLCFVR